MKTILALILLLLAAIPAVGHDAPSGWTYASGCCGGRDCRPIPDTAVAPVEGGWLVKASHEVIPYQSTKPSPDGSFHRCSYNGAETSETICLYVPPMGQ